jgi:hypothetical protein
VHRVCGLVCPLDVQALDAAAVARLRGDGRTIGFASLKKDQTADRRQRERSHTRLHRDTRASGGTCSESEGAL